jgi:F0F1-type ATP synthase membrane subunit b/b'
VTETSSKGASTAAPKEAEATPARTPEQIQADIDAAQQRLADQVDELSDRLAPQALAEDALGSVKKVFVEEDGSPKVKPIAIAAGTVTALLVLRKIFHR